MAEGIIFQKELEGLKVSESTLRVGADMKTRHYHETIELFAVMEGERYVFVDRYVYHLKPRTVLLIPPGQIHRTSSVEEHPSHRRFLLQYSREIYGRMIRATFGLTYDEFCQKYSGPVPIGEETWEEMLQIFGRLKEEMRRDETGQLYLPMVRMLSYEILLLFGREADRVREQNPSAGPVHVESGIYATIQLVTGYIQEHYDEDLRIERLTERFHISRGYLTRNFKEVTGVTIVQYLTVVRIRRAGKYLLDTDLSVTEIANRCGFGDVTYFEKVFRRLRGTTPRNYRRKIRESRVDPE